MARTITYTGVNVTVEVPNHEGTSTDEIGAFIADKAADWHLMLGGWGGERIIVRSVDFTQADADISDADTAPSDAPAPTQA
jgi:pyrrolidone-carboxylate peptidase